MKLLVRGTSALFFAAAILFATTQPAAAAAFSWYDWTGAMQVVHDGKDLGVQKGQDILVAQYAVKDDYRYFRMVLDGKPNQGANGFASTYGFFIDSGRTEKYISPNDPNYGDPALLNMGVDKYLSAETKPKLAGGINFAKNSGVLSGGIDYALDGVKFERNGRILDWAIKKDQLPDTFTWVAATFNHSTLTLLDKTASVVTPIPSAALLLGTGLIGLVGLRRRSARKA